MVKESVECLADIGHRILPRWQYGSLHEGLFPGVVPVFVRYHVLDPVRAIRLRAVPVPGGEH